MKSVLIYATVVGIVGAIASYSIATRLANSTRGVARVPRNS
jgi:hypothetical protein